MRVLDSLAAALPAGSRVLGQSPQAAAEPRHVLRDDPDSAWLASRCHWQIQALGLWWHCRSHCSAGEEDSAVVLAQYQVRALACAVAAALPSADHSLATPPRPGVAKFPSNPCKLRRAARLIVPPASACQHTVSTVPAHASSHAVCVHAQVLDPEMVTGGWSKSYMTYLVTTQPQGFSVRRRFKCVLRGCGGRRSCSW